MAGKMGKSTRPHKASGARTKYSDAPAVRRGGGVASKGTASATPRWSHAVGSFLGSSAAPAKAKRNAVGKARMKSGAATMARPGGGTKVKMQPRRGGVAAAHGEVKPRRAKGRPKMKPRNRAKQSATKQRVLYPSNALAKRFARFL